MFNLDIEKNRLILTKKCKEYLKSKDLKKFIELMNDFLIPIDIDRVDDYVITSYDPERVSISVIDKKNKIIYCSSYNSKENSVFGYNLVVETVTENDKIVNTYNGRNRKLINENLTVIRGDFEINVNKKLNDDISVTYSDVMSINTFEGRRMPIFTKSFSRENAGDKTIESECLKVHSIGNNPYRKGEKIDEVVSTYDDNVIYKINDSSIYSNNVNGVCFNNSNISEEIIKNSLFDVFNSTSSLKYFLPDTKSVMLFECDDSNSICNVKIVKSKDKIDVYYDKSCLNDKGFISEHLEFPVLVYGSISNDEIKLLSNYLEKAYDDDLVYSICNRLENFGSIINKDLTCSKEFDLIDKDFYNYSMSNIRSIFSRDKDLYFDYMNDKYHSLIDDIRIPKENVKTLLKKV